MALELPVLGEFTPFGHSFVDEPTTRAPHLSTHSSGSPGRRTSLNSYSLNDSYSASHYSYSLNRATLNRVILQPPPSVPPSVPKLPKGEEELYVSPHTVVVSRGVHGIGTGVLKATFTFDAVKQSISHVVWGWFGDTEVAERGRPREHGRQASGSLSETSKPASSSSRSRALCVLFRDTIAFQFDDGRSFLTNLPFPVRSVFALPGSHGGILLERETAGNGAERGKGSQAASVTAANGAEREKGSQAASVNVNVNATHQANGNGTPTLYSLMHPLENPRPVAVSNDSAFSDPNNRNSDANSTCVFRLPDEDLIFVSSDSDSDSNAPLIVTSNTATGKHTIWTYSLKPVDRIDRARLFPSPNPNPTNVTVPGSPLLPRRTTAGNADSSRNPRKPSIRRSSALSFSASESPFRTDLEKVAAEDGDGDRFAKSITAWLEAPILFLRKIWESEPTTTDTPGCCTAHIAHTASAAKVLILHSEARKKAVGVHLGPPARTLFQLDASSVVSLESTRTGLGLTDLLILKTEGTLALWSGEIAEDGGAPVLVPCELPRNFQGSVGGVPGAKKRRRETGDGTGEEEPMGEFPVFRSPSRGSRVVRLSDPVGGRVNMLLSDGKTIRVDARCVGEGHAVSVLLDALAWGVPSRQWASFRGRYLRAKPLGGSGWPSDWERFLLAFLSYCHGNAAVAPAAAADKGRMSPWEQMLASDLHAGLLDDPCFRNFPAPAFAPEDRLQRLFEASKELHLQQHTEPSFRPLFPSILAALHLAYEELKLNVLTQKEGAKLAGLLLALAAAVGADDYIDYYCRDGHANVELPFGRLAAENSGAAKLGSPPDVYRWVYDTVRTGNAGGFPTLASQRERLLPEFAGLEVPNGKPELPNLANVTFVYRALVEGGPASAVSALVKRGVTAEALDCWPDGIALPLREAIRACRVEPPADWPAEAYVLLDREDLAEQRSGIRSSGAYARNHVPAIASEEEEVAVPDLGKLSADALRAADDSSKPTESARQFSEVDKLRFAKDRRLEHVIELLQTEMPVKSKLPPAPDGSDDPSEIPPRQQSFLAVLASRTYAIPAGRAILDYSTVRVLTNTELEPRPLVVSAKFGRSVVALDLSPFPDDSSDWPEFHDGVAQGLQIAPECQDVDSSWIVYHRPEDVTTPRHAGFLFALGLNGHLRKMSSYHSLTYLTSKHDLTSIGLLLGLAAAHVGTCDEQVTRMLAVHVPAMLPHQASDMNVSSATQIASVLGLGLVYMDSANRRNVEVLLSEIGRREIPVMANETISANQYREGYSLAAGFALGFITLGKGDTAHGLADLRIVDELFRYINGGVDRRRQRDKLKPRNNLTDNAISALHSSAYKETDKINTDITLPGAIVALALMYLKTENEAIASKLTLPDSPYMLDHMRPDFMLLRVLARSLIMWKTIKPTREWIAAQSTDYIRKTYDILCDEDEQGVEHSSVDPSTADSVTMGYYSIVTGACLAVAVKYAGTGNPMACTAVLHYFDWFAKMLSSSVVTFADKVLRATVRGCANATLVCAGIIMAGTGDLEVLRRTRKMYGRVSSEVSCGDHMATAMTMGFLFLGNGSYTLGTSNKAVAALLCALYPKFPTHISDNRGHLQALRHLWVLAVEARCLVTRDVDTRQVCPIPVEVTIAGSTKPGAKAGSAPPSSRTVTLVTPCLVPEWHRVLAISIRSPRYYPVSIELGEQDSPIRKQLLSTRTVLVKRKTGHLSYQQDPRGIRSLFARSFPKVFASYDPEASASSPDAAVESAVGRLHNLVKSFSADPNILAFAEHLCVTGPDDEPSATQLAVFCTSVLQECLASDKPDALKIYLALYQTMNGLNSADCEAIWNAKLVVNFYRSGAYKRILGSGSGRSNGTAMLLTPLLNEDFVTSLEQQLDSFLEVDRSRLLGKYLAEVVKAERAGPFAWPAGSSSDSIALGRLLVFKNVPAPSVIGEMRSRLHQQLEEEGNNGTVSWDKQQLAVWMIAEMLPDVPLDTVSDIARHLAN